MRAWSARLDGAHGAAAQCCHGCRIGAHAIIGGCAKIVQDVPPFLIADGNPPPIARTLDFTLTEVERGRAVFTVVPGEHHYNPIGSVHGGLAATLCDSACGCAVQSTLPAGAAYTTMDLTIKMLRGITVDTGTLFCEGTIIHAGRRTALAEARLTDTAGKLYAFATSTCMIFPAGG